MHHNYIGEFKRVVLTPLSLGDIEPLREVRNRVRHCFVYSDEISGEAQQKWYESYLLKDDDYMFRVARTDRPEIFIGAVSLYNIDAVDKSAEFGRIVIDREVAGQGGLGFDATACACKIGFEQLGLREIYLEVFADNVKAIHTYQKAGFITFKQSGSLLHMKLDQENFYRVKGNNHVDTTF